MCCNLGNLFICYILGNLSMSYLVSIYVLQRTSGAGAETAWIGAPNTNYGLHEQHTLQIHQPRQVQVQKPYQVRH